jgi:hypothetical protein
MKAKTKKVKVVAGGEKHVVYKKTTKKGEGKVGHIMVNHPTKDKGQWDTIDLTAKGKAKTVDQGVAATKKWHRDNPDYIYKGDKMNKSVKTTVKKSSLPKAQAGKIIKSVLKGMVEGAKTGYKTAKTAGSVADKTKKLNNAREIARAKKLAKAEKFGDKGQYARLEDMKRSEFYRDRRNAGKTFQSSGSGITKKKLRNIAIGTGILGTYLGVGSAAVSSASDDKKKAKKPKVNKTKPRYKF